MIKRILPAVAVLLLAACSATATTAHTAAASVPSPAAIAAALGCQVSGPDINPQDAYDTTAYDSLNAAGDPSSPCYAGNAIADAVITFPSQAKETDWLHQNDLANSGQFAQGYVGLVEGPLWVVADGSGVVGIDSLTHALAKFGGREVTSF